MAGTARVLRVAVVGLRHLHPRLYMPLFQATPLTNVVAVVEADGRLRRAFASEFGLQGCAKLDELLASEKPDVAAIFLPHDECPEAAEQCARAGVHVMVEKPVAAASKQAERAVRAAREAKVKFTTGYCWRMHPVARECKRLIQAGFLGRIVGAEGRCAAGRVRRYIDGNAAWMLQRRHAGGGPLFNLGVHWIDLFRWMFEDEIVEVCGHNVRVNTRYDIEDNSFAHLHFSKGAVAALDISYTVPDAYPNSRDLYIGIRGTRGCLSWAPAFEGENDVLMVCCDAPEFAGSPLRHIEFRLEPVKGYGGCMGMAYVRGFAEAVLGDTSPEITGEDAIAVLRVVEAVYESASTRRSAKVRG